MWCQACQHDVPSAASDAPEADRCRTCGNSLASEPPTACEAAAQAPLATPRIPDEDWQLEADLRSVQRLLAGLRTTRIDPPAAAATPHLPPAPATNPAIAAAPPKANAAAWTVLSLGLAVLACGAVLLGLAVAQERDDLWSLGLPIAIGGQAALIVGVVLQLEVLWHANRQVLDAELARLRPAAPPAMPPAVRTGV